MGTKEQCVSMSVFVRSAWSAKRGEQREHERGAGSLLLVGVEVDVQLGVDVRDELQQQVHSLVLFGGRLGAHVLHLLLGALGDAGLHVTSSAQNLTRPIGIFGKIKQTITVKEAKTKKYNVYLAFMIGVFSFFLRFEKLNLGSRLIFRLLQPLLFLYTLNEKLKFEFRIIRFFNRTSLSLVNLFSSAFLCCKKLLNSC